MAVHLLIDANKKPLYTPLEKFEYSNTNYVLLARIVEIVTKDSFEDFMKMTVFEPMEMKNSRVWNLNSKDKSFPNKADDIEIIDDDYIELEPSYIDGVAGDGAVFTSLDDLVIWDDFWNGKYLLTSNEISQAFEEVELLDGRISKYGFGWSLNKKGMWHNGGWLGARSVLIKNVKAKTCIAVIDNCSNLYFDKIHDEIENLSNAWGES